MLNKSIVAILEKYICNIDFASNHLLYVNENDEIDIKNGMTKFRGKVRNTGKGSKGYVCVVQTKDAHVRRASHRFPWEQKESEG